MSAVTGKDDDKEGKTALCKRVEQLDEALELATKGVLALAAGGGHATPQNAASQKCASRGGAGACASGRGKPGHGVRLRFAETLKPTLATSVSR